MLVITGDGTPNPRNVAPRQEIRPYEGLMNRQVNIFGELDSLSYKEGRFTSQ